MRTVSYQTGTAPASLVVVRGIGRALNPTDRSGKPQGTNLSAHNYDNVKARHRITDFVLTGKVTATGLKHAKAVGGGLVNTPRTEAFDTPVRVWEKNTGWMTVAGGKDGLTITYAPDARVVYAEVVDKKGNTTIVLDMSLKDYMDTYC